MGEGSAEPKTPLRRGQVKAESRCPPMRSQRSTSLPAGVLSCAPAPALVPPELPQLGLLSFSSQRQFSGISLERLLGQKSSFRPSPVH